VSPPAELGRRRARLEIQCIYSTVVICHTRVSMLPLGRDEYTAKDKGVRDGAADY
jgi:hypothetical protein